MAELTQDQHLRLETLLQSGGLTPEQTKRVKTLLGTSTIKYPPPTPGEFPPNIMRSPFDTPQWAYDVDKFTQSPEGQRLMMEGAGGVAGALFPPAGIAAKVLPRAGPLIARSIQSGVGEAAGSLAAESVDPSESPAKSAAVSFGLGTLGNVAGEAAIPLVKKALAPVVSKLEPGARTLIRTVTGKGGVVTPGTALDLRSLDLLENIAESSLFGAGKLRLAKQKMRGLMQESVEDFARIFASKVSKEDIGVVLQHLIEEGADVFRTAARVKYRNVDKLTEGIGVETAAIKNVMQSVLEKSEKGLGSPTIRKMARRIEALGDVEPFAVLQELRSDLLAIVRGSTDIVGGKAQGAGKLLASRVDKAMEFSSAKLKPDALTAFREANAFWKQGKQTFNSTFIKGLAKKDADVVYQSAIRAGRPLLIRKLRETIADPEVWKDIQGQFFADVLSKSVDIDDVISGRRILTELKKFGTPAMKELFPGQTSATFKKMAQALKLSQQAASEEGTGKLFIQFTQGGALLNLASGGPFPGTSAAVLLGPPALARVFTNKMMTKWLTIGLTSPPGSSQTIRAVAQLIAAMQKEGLIEKIETQ